MYKHNPHPGKIDPHGNFQEIMKVGACTIASVSLGSWQYSF
jgi:hypothetical protein